jgi:hypothetical protein
MATNVLAPTGLVFSRMKIGAAPSAQVQAYKIRKGYNSSAIGMNDLVKTGSGANQGYIVPSVFNDTSGIGVFAGVAPYFDATFQSVQHGLIGSWPTTANPTADVDCWVIADPFAVFRIQASGGPWSTSYRGLNCNWLTGTNAAPNPVGISTLTLDLTTTGTSNTLPFRIEGVVGVSGGPQDPANTNPVLEVSLNPAWIESLQGTGI